jgi:hypothetical protein
MTANIVLVLVFDSGARTDPDRLLSVGFWVLAALKAATKGAELESPRHTGMLMAAGAGTVKETGLLGACRGPGLWAKLPVTAVNAENTEETPWKRSGHCFSH